MLSEANPQSFLTREAVLPTGRDFSKSLTHLDGKSELNVPLPGLFTSPQYCHIPEGTGGNDWDVRVLTLKPLLPASPQPSYFRSTPAALWAAFPGSQDPLCLDGGGVLVNGEKGSSDL